MVVTQVIDQRDSNSISTRYIARQVQSNVRSQQRGMVVIQESQQIVISAFSTDNGINNIRATPTGIASAQSNTTAQANTNVLTFDPDNIPAVSNSSMILPAGVP